MVAPAPRAVAWSYRRKQDEASFLGLVQEQAVGHRLTKMLALEPWARGRVAAQAERLASSSARLAASMMLVLTLEPR